MKVTGGLCEIPSNLRYRLSLQAKAEAFFLFDVMRLGFRGLGLGRSSPEQE